MVFTPPSIVVTTWVNPPAGSMYSVCPCATDTAARDKVATNPTSCFIDIGSSGSTYMTGCGCSDPTGAPTALNSNQVLDCVSNRRISSGP